MGPEGVIELPTNMSEVQRQDVKCIRFWKPIFDALAKNGFSIEELSILRSCHALDFYACLQ